MKECLYLSSSFVIFSSTCWHLILLHAMILSEMWKCRIWDQLLVTNIAGREERMCCSYVTTLWLVSYCKGICIIITLWTHMCTHTLFYTHWALSSCNYCILSNSLYYYIPGHQMYLKVLFHIHCRKYKYGNMILSLQDNISRC